MRLQSFSIRSLDGTSSIPPKDESTYSYRNHHSIQSSADVTNLVQHLPCDPLDAASIPRPMTNLQAGTHNANVIFPVTVGDPSFGSYGTLARLLWSITIIILLQTRKAPQEMDLMPSRSMRCTMVTLWRRAITLIPWHLSEPDLAVISHSFWCGKQDDR